MKNTEKKDEDLVKIVQPLVDWYRENKRDLPWRHNPDAYRVWISEIMLQQTRVEAVKGYYDRFLKALPTVKDLAEAEEDKLLKLWEGLGYYNRVRNMQKAAQQIMVDHEGIFPDNYEEILQLKGIGNYTAGAISAFAYGIPKPAVDGNVLRVISRITGSYEDIMKQSVRRKIENTLEQVIPSDAASDFNQGLIELGAIVCVPNGEPKCEECPVASLCQAYCHGTVDRFPIKAAKKERRQEDKTVFIIQDGEATALRKRPSKGLLAGLYELPNVPGHIDRERALEYVRKLGLDPLYIEEMPSSRHIFSHIEWRMEAYRIRVSSLEKAKDKDLIFADKEQTGKRYAIPSAFGAYARYIKEEKR